MMTCQPPHKTRSLIFPDRQKCISSCLSSCHVASMQADRGKGKHRWIKTTSETPACHFPVTLSLTGWVITVGKANNNRDEQKALGMQRDSIIWDYTGYDPAWCIAVIELFNPRWFMVHLSVVNQILTVCTMSCTGHGVLVVCWLQQHWVIIVNLWYHSR